MGIIIITYPTTIDHYKMAFINDMLQQLYRDPLTLPIRLNDSFKQNLQNRIDEELNKK